MARNLVLVRMTRNHKTNTGNGATFPVDELPKDYIFVAEEYGTPDKPNLWLTLDMKSTHLPEDAIERIL